MIKFTVDGNNVSVEVDCLRFKLTAPQYMKASAYFEDKPFLCDKMIDGAFQYYRRKQWKMKKNS